MRVRLIRLSGGELDHEMLWASVATLAAAVAWIWLSRLGPPPLVCPFHALTGGIPCPSCGTTRALMLLLEGDFSASIRNHPAVGPGVVIGAAMWVYAWAVVVFRLPRIRVSASARAATAVRWGVVAFVAGIWAVQVANGA
ncbi:MAG: DUF2752 domain-containing protein [Vicinamibacterales bacterium]